MEVPRKAPSCFCSFRDSSLQEAGPGLSLELTKTQPGGGRDRRSSGLTLRVLKAMGVSMSTSTVILLGSSER